MRSRCPADVDPPALHQAADVVVPLDCGDVKFLVAVRWHLEKECARGHGDYHRDPRSSEVLRGADGRCCYVYEDVYVWDGFERVDGQEGGCRGM